MDVIYVAGDVLVVIDVISCIVEAIALCLCSPWKPCYHVLLSSVVLSSSKVMLFTLIITST